jgi:hypothetical protein
MKDFFEALNTEGGHLVITIGLILWLSLIATILHMTNHDPAETGRTLLSHAFTALITLLLNKLGNKK